MFDNSLGNEAALRKIALDLIEYDKINNHYDYMDDFGSGLEEASTEQIVKDLKANKGKMYIASMQQLMEHVDDPEELIKGKRIIESIKGLNSIEYDMTIEPNLLYEEIASKEVLDFDGMYTDYTLYKNTDTDEYVCVFGDKDIYLPEDGDFDMTCETEEEAWEWFNSYTGAEDFLVKSPENMSKLVREYYEEGKDLKYLANFIFSTEMYDENDVVRETLKLGYKKEDILDVLEYDLGVDMYEYHYKNAIEDFEEKSRKKYRPIENISYDDVIGFAKEHIESELNGVEGVEVLNVLMYGSRSRGKEKTKSDLDILVEYKGDMKDDTLFNILNEKGVKIGNTKLDFNPIQKSKVDIKDFLLDAEKYMKHAYKKAKSR